MESPFYKKILLKLSGEALMGEQEFGISSDVITSYAKQIKEIADLGVEVSIVIGGGNIFRGLSGAAQGVDRVTGDHMGMLATVINSLALQNSIEKLGVHMRPHSLNTIRQGAFHQHPRANHSSVPHRTLCYQGSRPVRTAPTPAPKARNR